MIEINETNICIRPSAIDTFYGCAYQWGKVFLEGVVTIPNARAAIGTGIHAGVEVMWNESIAAQDKVVHKDSMYDAAIESFKEEGKKGLKYNDGENNKTAEAEIIKGTDAFVDDIVPFAKIPVAVETRFDINIIDHPIVGSVGGTLDYLGTDTIADVKTSKRKSGTAGYVIQQSVYKMLAEEHGHKVKQNLIHQVIMTKQPTGAILDLEPNVDQAKFVINTMLDTLELVHKDVRPIESILRGNPKYMFCSEKFCALHHCCPFVNGKVEAPKEEFKKPKL